MKKTNESKTVAIIAYDVTLKRPGCALLQAAMGASVPSDKLMEMSDQWLLAPTPDLKLYPCTEEELEAIIQITLAAAKNPGRWQKASRQRRRTFGRAAKR